MSRNFCCRHLIQKQKDISKAHQIKMNDIVKALKWLEIDMDLDEVTTYQPKLIVLWSFKLFTNFSFSDGAT